MKQYTSLSNTLHVLKCLYIFPSMTGLLKSGAVKQEDRPIWYDVVKALPPKPIPQVREIQKVVYPEDFVRV